MGKEDKCEASVEVMKWHGWGSPVGVAVFFIGIATLLMAISCLLK